MEIALCHHEPAFAIAVPPGANRTVAGGLRRPCSGTQHSPQFDANACRHDWACGTGYPHTQAHAQWVSGLNRDSSASCYCKSDRSCCSSSPYHCNLQSYVDTNACNYTHSACRYSHACNYTHSACCYSHACNYTYSACRYRHACNYTYSACRYRHACNYTYSACRYRYSDSRTNRD